MEEDAIFFFSKIKMMIKYYILLFFQTLTLLLVLEDPFADDNSQNQDDKRGVDIGRSEGCCIWRHGLNSKRIVTSSSRSGADFVAYTTATRGQPFLPQSLFLKYKGKSILVSILPKIVFKWCL